MAAPNAPVCALFLLTSTPHNILSKPLTAFPHIYHQNNRQHLEKNEPNRNDYCLSSERIFAEPGIELVTLCSQVLYNIDGVIPLCWSLQLSTLAMTSTMI